MSERLCPGCGGRLAAAHLGPVGLDLCLSCAGVWFDRGELPQVLQAGPVVVRRLSGKAASVPVSSPSLNSHAACPACRMPLLETPFAPMPGTSLHTCSGCAGYWVPCRILARIADAMETIEAGAGPSAPAPAAAPQANGATAAVEQAPAPAAPSSRTGCPDCGEACSPRDSSCWACGRRLQGVAARACPRCNGVVRRHDCGGVEVGSCESCGGVWFAQGKLKAVLFQSSQDQERLLREVDRSRSGKRRDCRNEIRCPHCDQAMREQHLGSFSHEAVDTCPACSASFLDRDRLEKILLGRG